MLRESITSTRRSGFCSRKISRAVIALAQLPERREEIVTAITYSASGRSQLESAAISHLYIVHTFFRALTRSAMLWYHNTNIVLNFLQTV